MIYRFSINNNLCFRLINFYVLLILIKLVFNNIFELYLKGGKILCDYYLLIIKLKLRCILLTYLRYLILFFFDFSKLEQFLI